MISLTTSQRPWSGVSLLYTSTESRAVKTKVAPLWIDEMNVGSVWLDLELVLQKAAYTL